MRNRERLRKMNAPFSVFQDKITTDMNSNDRQSARTGRRKAFTEESFLGDMGVENKEVSDQSF